MRLMKLARDFLAGKPIVRRSPLWRAARKQHLAIEPNCCACGTSEKLEVHHIVPVSQDRSLELVPSNFITLCDGKRSCHLEIGHLGSWRRANPHVREDAAVALLVRRASAS